MITISAASAQKPAIRLMREDDLEKVAEIDQLSFSIPWPKRAYEYELCENPNSLCWVAEIQSPDGRRQVCGMIVIWLILDEAHIATFAVHPDHRGKGLAKRMLRTALIAANHHGTTQATLEVRAGNYKAQELYQYFKFEEVGQRPRYYKDNNEDAIIMTVSGLGKEYLNWLTTQTINFD
ncbi:MAG: ribosomal protein S18-alanine N-acetyltransferase [Chloroflexota bacterium]|nr:ribosomal protein S18-alanine N-acetyltransferase [Chloroflexota bacterium]